MEKDINIMIGTKIRAYLESKGYVQSDVAKILKMSQGAVSLYYKGKPIGKNSAKKWSEAFGFRENWLLTGEGDMLRNDGIIADHISGGNQILNQRNSGSTINQNAITIELPERGSKKIINPDGSVRVESENCPDETLTEYLRGEISRLQQKIEELTESNMELRSENAVLKYQIMVLNK